MKITNYKVEGCTYKGFAGKLKYPINNGNLFSLSYTCDGIKNTAWVDNMCYENFEYLLTAGELPNELECDLVNDLLIITDHHIIDNFNGFLKTN